MTYKSNNFHRTPDIIWSDDHVISYSQMWQLKLKEIPCIRIIKPGSVSWYIGCIREYAMGKWKGPALVGTLDLFPTPCNLQIQSKTDTNKTKRRVHVRHKSFIESYRRLAVTIFPKEGETKIIKENKLIAANCLYKTSPLANNREWLVYFLLKKIVLVLY